MLGLFYSPLREAWQLFLDVAPFLLLGFAIAGALHAFLGKKFIKKHLGKGSFSSVVKSVIFGIPLPVCSCGVIPIAASIKRQGARRSSVLAFLYSTPTTGVDSILATYAFLGPAMAVFRPMAALVGGLILGGLALKLEKGKEPQTISPEMETPEKAEKKASVKDALYHGFAYLPGEIGKWIIIGVIVGGAITAFIPESVFTTYLSSAYITYPLMLAVSIPLYVCATGSIPIAAALIWKGLSPGAALAFLIAGPATNAITITFVLKDLGKKMMLLYLSVIAITATAFGLAFDFLWRISGASFNFLEGGGRYMSYPLKLASALVLIGLFVIAKIYGKELKEGVEMKMKFKVPNMTCQGCVRAIKERLSSLEGVKEIYVDLKSREVLVDGDAPLEVVERAIEEAGYSVEAKEAL